MSRGGRGGGARGGGRGGRPGTTKIGGIEIAYDEGLEENLKRPQPLPLYPTYQPPDQTPLSSSELSAAQKSLHIRNLLRSSPLYTASSRGTNEDYSRLKNPFEDMDTYSKRYYKQPRLLPNLKVHWNPLVVGDTKEVAVAGSDTQTATTEVKTGSKRRRRPEGSLLGRKGFPKELWAVLGIAVKRDEQDGSRKKARRQGPLDDALFVDDEEDGEDGDREKGEDNAEEDEDKLEDDEFEEDEDDEGGDYNAENYFDDGEDVGDEDEGGGGEEWS